jgi:potassium channel LctB
MESVLRKPIIRLILLLVVMGIMLRLPSIFPKFIESESVLSHALTFLFIGISIYSLLLIFHIIFHILIKRPLNQLLSAPNIASLIFSYAILLLGILLLISLAFMEITRLNLGYLTYGQCTDKFSKEMIKNDQSMSRDYFYFSAVTFFTIGYGDICPMGLSKILSVLTAFIGNIISVVLMAIVISMYLNRKSQTDLL